MGEIQQREAHRLLSIISKAVRAKRLLTYKEVAKALGRDPKTNSRMVAQVCDLLDAAAELAGVPLLALYWVRESSSRKINRNAFRQDPAERNARIARSEAHSFTVRDFTAINRALRALDGLGNRAAWKWVKDLRQRTFREFSMQQPSPNSDAINDIGADIPQAAIVSGKRYARDPRIRKAVISRANDRCEYCHKLGFPCRDGSRYLESHHIIALANEGADRMTNVIALCPDDHRKAHFSRERKELEQKMTLPPSFIQPRLESGGW